MWSSAKSNSSMPQISYPSPNHLVAVHEQPHYTRELLLLMLLSCLPMGLVYVRCMHGQGAAYCRTRHAQPHDTHRHTAVLTITPHTPPNTLCPLCNRPRSHHTQSHAGPHRMPTTALPERQHTQASSGQQGPALLPPAPGIPAHAQRSLLTAHCTASVCVLGVAGQRTAPTCMAGVRGQHMTTRVGHRGPTPWLPVNVESEMVWVPRL
jgi:hypothetical protein